MYLPFTREQFLETFAHYNLAVSPFQWFNYVLGLLAIALAFRRSRLSARLSCLILSFFWLWSGLVYHLAFFSAINPLAYVFGAFFVVQSGMLFWKGTWRSELNFRLQMKPREMSGAFLICAALFMYPPLSYLAGHRYPMAPTFGLPCPITLLTLGLLLCSRPRAARYILLIPVLWSIIGLVAAIQLGMHEDYLLMIASIAGILTLASPLKLVLHQNDQGVRGKV